MALYLGGSLSPHLKEGMDLIRTLVESIKAKDSMLKARLATVLAASRIHRLASYVVKNATTGVNTFPSGHVAVTIAVALGVFPSLPVLGVLLLLCAVSIAVACVVGRWKSTEIICPLIQRWALFS